MSKIRVLCTADLHIGRSSALMIECAAVDGSATGVWKRIVDLAILEEADAVAIAGDVFDGRAGFVEGRQAFLAGLKALAIRGIPVVAVAGNHDFDVLRLIDHVGHENFHLLGKAGNWEWKVLETRSGKVGFVGWSFPSEHVAQCQLGRLSRADEGLPLIGLVHGDTTPNSRYHPFSLSDFAGKADAWLLGHIHKPGPLHATVWYPGSPQALDFGPGEQGIHGVCWLEIENGVAAFSEMRPLSTVRYETVRLTVICKPGQDPLDCALEAARLRCLELGDRQTFHSVQLRAELIFEGIEKLPKLGDLVTHQILDTHCVTFTALRLRQQIDPWSLKDLNNQQGEAARLLIGTRHLNMTLDGSQVQPGWVEAARKLIDQSSVDIDQQFNRTLGSVQDRGEATLEPPDSEERFRLAHQWVTEELEAMLSVEST